jgi:protein-tyrosine phosphatase
VLRGGRLSELAPSSQQTLLDYGLKMVIDLRRPTELADSPSVFADLEGVNYYHTPLIEEESLVRKFDSLTELYEGILASSQKQIKEILEIIADSTDGAILVNCTGGKDRTGIIIALLLGIANVPVVTIAEDYALSNGYLTNLNNTLREKAAAAGYNMEHFEMLLTSKKESMLETLSHIEANYGGIPAYLTLIGLTERNIQKIQSRLVVAR